LKKVSIILIIIMGLLIALSGCQGTVQNGQNQPNQNNTQGNAQDASDLANNSSDRGSDYRIIEAVTTDPRGGNSWTELSDCSFDLDKDGQEDKIVLYTAAGRDEKGKLVWDDGQNWLLLIQSGDRYYPLLNEFVQLGSVYFTVFEPYDGEMPKVSVIVSTGAGFMLTNYSFDREEQGFREEPVYQEDGINLLHSSLPAYQ